MQAGPPNQRIVVPASETSPTDSPCLASRALLVAGAADAAFSGQQQDGVVTLTELYLYLRQSLAAQNLPIAQAPCLWSLKDWARRGACDS